eukprot:Skav227917  [mRNA]  locus=scaffold146:152871:153363:+ [translate_table: standard]
MLRIAAFSLAAVLAVFCTLFLVSRNEVFHSSGRFLKADDSCSSAGEMCSETQCCSQRFENCFQRRAF